MRATAFILILTVLVCAAMQVNADAASMLCLVNKERAAQGLAPMVLNSALISAAQAHSEDMANTKVMSHTGSDGSTPWERMARAGYSGASSMAENVAAGYTSEEAVMKGWMNSAGHRANILGNFNEFGMGLKSNYWTQTFGYRRGVDTSGAAAYCSGGSPTTPATTPTPSRVATPSTARVEPTPTTVRPTSAVAQPTSTVAKSTSTTTIITQPTATPCWGSKPPQTYAEWLIAKQRCNWFFRTQ